MGLGNYCDFNENENRKRLVLSVKSKKRRKRDREQRAFVQSIEECWSQMCAVSEQEAFIKGVRFAMMFVVKVFGYESPRERRGVSK